MRPTHRSALYTVVKMLLVYRQSKKKKFWRNGWMSVYYCMRLGAAPLHTGRLRVLYSLQLLNTTVGQDLENDKVVGVLHGIEW